MADKKYRTRSIKQRTGSAVMAVSNQMDFNVIDEKVSQEFHPYFYILMGRIFAGDDCFTVLISRRGVRMLELLGIGSAACSFIFIIFSFTKTKYFRKQSNESAMSPWITIWRKVWWSDCLESARPHLLPFYSFWENITLIERMRKTCKIES